MTMSTPRKYPMSGDSGATTGTWIKCWAGKVKGRPPVGHYVNHRLEAVDAASIPYRMQGDPGHREQPPAESWPTLRPSSQSGAAGPASQVLLVPVARKVVMR